MKLTKRQKNDAAQIADALKAAVSHHEAGRFPEAAAIYRQIIQRDPRHPVALHFMGMLAFQTGDLKVALDLTNKSIKADPDNPLYFYNQALIYRAKGDLTAAVERYRRAISLNPNYSEAHFNLGLALFELGDALQDFNVLNQAEASFRRVLKIQSYPEVYQNLGSTLRALGRVDEALECFGQSFPAGMNWKNELHRLTTPMVILNGLDLTEGKAQEGEASPASVARRQQASASLKIALIYPPASKLADDGGNLDSQTITYGLLTIAAQARRAGHEVTIHNLSGTPWPEVASLIAQTKADVYGISAFTFNRHGMGAVAELIRQHHPQVQIVAGGPFPTAVPKETLKFFRAIDTVVIGEGEETFMELLEGVANGRPTAGIAGSAWREGESVRVGPARPRIDELDALASPFDHFASPIVITSRGCPSKCTFCGSFSTWGKKLRFHSVAYCLDMFHKALAQLPVPFLGIKDDTFTADKRRAIAVCDAIIESKLNFVWSCDTRVDCLDDELLHKMRVAGCQMISFGIESGAPEILKSILKDTTPEMVLKATRAAQKHGFYIRYYMILLNRGETLETMAQSNALIKEGRPDEFIFSPLAFNPGTEEWDIFSEKQGLTAVIFFKNDFSDLSVDMKREPAVNQLLRKVMVDIGTLKGFHYSVEEREAIIDLHPEVATARVELAHAYLRAGRLDEAKAQLGKAEELGFPIEVIIGNQRACIALAENRIDHALALLEGGSKAFPCAVLQKNHATLKAWAAQPSQKRGKVPVLDDSVNAVDFI